MGYQKLGRIVEQTVSIATAAGTTTLMNSSKQNQRFTGTDTQTVVFPDATTCPNGTLFRIANDSSDPIVLQYNDASALATLSGGDDALFVLFDNATANGVWRQYSSGSSADSKPLKVVASTTGAQSITTATITTILLGNEIEDDLNCFNGGTGEFTVPTGYAGFYLFSMILETESPVSAESDLYFDVNGSTIFHPYYNVVGNTYTVATTFGHSLAEGDVVRFRYRHNRGSNINIGDPNYTRLTITRYNPGGAVPDTVAVIVDSSATSLTSGGVTIVPTNETKDTKAAHSAGVFTCPVGFAGFYQCSMYLQGSSASYNANDSLGAYLDVQGVLYPLGADRVQTAGTHGLIASGSQLVYLGEGETITFKGNSTTSTTISNFQASIIRVAGPT